MQTRRNSILQKKQLQDRQQQDRQLQDRQQQSTTSVYCIQLKEVLSNSWQGFFEGLEFETLTRGDKEITVMRGTYATQDEFQRILQRLEEMNLHYQKVTVDIIQDSSQNKSKSRLNGLSSHTWIHEVS